MLIDHTHKEKGILARGEKKSLQTDRVILVRGPEEEVRIVQWIYQMFIRENRSEREIAEILNAQGILTDLGRPWTRGTVREILTNEKYIGNNVYNRRSFKLKKNRVVNTPDMWVRREGAFDPIISPEDFYTAQGIILARARRLTDDEMLERLRGLLAKHSLLSSGLIDSAEGMPASSAYRTRFGSLLRAYQLAGYRPDRDYGFLEINRTLGQLHPQLLDDVLQQLGGVGAQVTRDGDGLAADQWRVHGVDGAVPLPPDRRGPVAVAGAHRPDASARHHDPGPHGRDQPASGRLLPVADHGHRSPQAAPVRNQRRPPGHLPV